MVYQVPASATYTVPFKVERGSEDSVHAHVGAVATDPRNDGRVLSALTRRGTYKAANYHGHNGVFTPGHVKKTAAFFNKAVERGLQAESTTIVQRPASGAPTPEGMDFLMREYETRKPITPLRYYR